MLNKKKYALVVPTFNREAILDNFLKCMKRQTLQPDLIVVVNDGSKDGTDALLKRDYPEVVQIIGVGDWWWTGSVNQGISYILENHPEIEGIILQNDDTSFNDNWFEKLVTKAQETPDALIGCVAANQDTPDLVAYAGRKKNSWFAISKKHHVGKPLADFDPERLQPSFDLIGRGCYIPAKVFREIGIFDAEHFKHRGDTELPLRARVAGYKLYVYFGALVYIRPLETSSIDVKEYYTFGDFKAKFFDFRSSAYWKYRYYYAKTLSKGNYLQWYTFFVCRMILHFAAYAVKLKPFKPQAK